MKLLRMVRGRSCRSDGIYSDKTGTESKSSMVLPVVVLL